jgi:hypothetical protein
MKIMESFINKSSGILTIDELKQQNINKYYINKLIDKGVIERYEKGIYVRKDVFEDEYYIFQKRNSNVIFSYNTALYLQNMTERTPLKIEITIYSGYNTHRFSNNIKVYYVKKEYLSLGTIQVKTPFGFDVTAYNLERTLCDFIKNENAKLDKEMTNKFIQKMFLEKKVDTSKLIEYAKKLKCEKKVRGIMEVLM